MTPTILVTGTSGKLGALVVEQLLSQGAKPDSIVAMVRSEEKGQPLKAKGVQVRIGDYGNAESLNKALEGVSHALLISSNNVSSPTARVEEHTAFIDAVKRTTPSLKLLAYTSLPRADTSSMLLAADHKKTEELIAASGIPYSFLRNGWYIENQTEQSAGWLHSGSIFGPSGQGRISAASRKDYAEAAAKVLLLETPPKQVYELGGKPGYTLDELAEVATKVFGKPIKAVHISEADYAKALSSFGLPELFVKVIADADAKSADGSLEVAGDDLQTLLGHPSETVEDVLRRQKV